MPAKPGDGFECCRGGMKGRRSPGPESKKETDSRTERPGQFLPEAPRHPASRAFQPQYIDQSGRPEQSARSPTPTAPCSPGTNVVRSGRPEQSRSKRSIRSTSRCRLNVVRSGRPEQSLMMELDSDLVQVGLNVVRSGRPEQFRNYTPHALVLYSGGVSM